MNCKFFSKVIYTLSLLIIVIFSINFAINSGYCNKPIKKIISYYLSRKNINAEIKQLYIKGNHLFAGDVLIKRKNLQIQMEKVKINFSLKKENKKILFNMGINIDNLSVFANDTKLLQTNIHSVYAKDFFNFTTSVINFDKLKIHTITNDKKPDFGLGKCIYTKNDHKTSYFECGLNFLQKSSVHFAIKKDAKILKSNIKIQKIPISIYKTTEDLIELRMLKFITENIENGYIAKGDISFNFNRNKKSLNLALLTKKLNANLELIDLTYNYNNNYPPLTKIHTEILINGSKINCSLYQAYSNNTLISGKITFNTQKPIESSLIEITLKAHGTVKDLINFLPRKHYNFLKKEGVDLNSIEGKAKTNINILIPISQKITNIYNINTMINFATLKILNNNINFNKLTIDGTFNELEDTIIAKGKINNNASDIYYNNNNSKKETTLKGQIKIFPKNQDIGLLKLISGNSILNFEYKNNDFINPTLKINANLNNLEFYIDKISIYKKIGEYADLNIDGILNKKKIFTFNLYGANNLKISGIIDNKDSRSNIILDTIRYKNSNLNANLVIDNNNLRAFIKGNTLDLSNAKMIQFLEKESERKNTQLKVDIKKIQLKNNISLENFKLQINCNTIKCFSGSLESSIENKPLQMSLVDNEESEQWTIRAENAGALLTGLGMYNNMKLGTAEFVLKTKRQEVKKGSIIPILNGTFNFQNFYITDMSFLTRIVSFVSLPGFLNLILNNKDIAFSQMNGHFKYKGDNITITHTQAKGPFFDFTMKGKINLASKHINLKGNVIPSFFFASTIIRKIPIIGKIFSKVAPYHIEFTYKE